MVQVQSPNRTMGTSIYNTPLSTKDKIMNDYDKIELISLIALTLSIWIACIGSMTA